MMRSDEELLELANIGIKHCNLMMETMSSSVLSQRAKLCVVQELVPTINSALSSIQSELTKRTIVRDPIAP